MTAPPLRNNASCGGVRRASPTSTNSTVIQNLRHLSATSKSVRFTGFGAAIHPRSPGSKPGKRLVRLKRAPAAAAQSTAGCACWKTRSKALRGHPRPQLALASRAGQSRAEQDRAGQGKAGRGGDTQLENCSLSSDVQSASRTTGRQVGQARARGADVMLRSATQVLRYSPSFILFLSLSLSRSLSLSLSLSVTWPRSSPTCFKPCPSPSVTRRTNSTTTAAVDAGG